MDFVILFLLFVVADWYFVRRNLKRDRPTRTYLREGPPLEGGSVKMTTAEKFRALARIQREAEQLLAQQEAIWDLVGQQTATTDELKDWEAP